MKATAEINGIRLAYADIGQGTPLLCLHGGMGIDARSLHVPGILDLADYGIRLIIPDQRGHGDSAVHDDAELTHAAWANDAKELARHLRVERCALLGHSYGGFIALECATRWPDSLSHLVLVATSVGPVRVPAAAVHTDAELRDHFRARWPLFFKADDKHWPLFDTLTFNARAYNTAFTRELPAYDLRERIADLDVAMLLIVGSEDAYLPHMQWLAGHARHATLRVLDGVGHFPFIEAREQFLSAVTTFLNPALRAPSTAPAHRPSRGQ